MKIQTALASLAVTASALTAGTMAVTTPAHAAACVTTHTYTHATTSRGSVTSRWTTRTACGRSYQKWERVTERSYTGSHYTENIYRDERAYPRYRQVTDKYSWSKKGIETHAVTVRTG